MNQFHKSEVLKKYSQTTPTKLGYPKKHHPQPNTFYPCVI